MNELLTQKELAKFLKVTTKTIQRYEKEGLPVFSDVPKRYDLEQVKKWLKAGGLHEKK